MPVTETSKRGKELAQKVKPKKSKKIVKKPSDKNTKKDSKKRSNYFAQSYRELKKVTWPSRKEAWRLTIAVIIFSAAFTGVTVLVDYIFKNIIQRYVI